MRFWSFSSPPHHDEAIGLLRDGLGAANARVSDLEQHLREYREKTDDQYNSAYARTAELYFEGSTTELKHRRDIERRLLERWNAHTENLDQLIATLRTENSRLSRACDAMEEQVGDLQRKLDDTPRINQMRDWMIELMTHFRKEHDDGEESDA